MSYWIGSECVELIGKRFKFRLMRRNDDIEDAESIAQNEDAGQTRAAPPWTAA